MDTFRKLLGFRSENRKMRDKRSGGEIKRHSPQGKPNPLANEMFNFLNGIFASDGKTNTTNYPDSKMYKDQNTEVERQVLNAKEVFNKKVSDLYKMVNRLGIPHRYANITEFEKDLNKSFWDGLNLFLKVQVNAEVENVKRPEATYATFGGKKVRIPADKIEDLERQHVNKSFQQVEQGQEASENMGVNNFAVKMFYLYSTYYYKTLKVCLEKKIPLPQSLKISERVYGHEGYIFDEFSDFLDSETIAKTLNNLPLRARESFAKWAEVGEKLLESYSGKDWSISPAFIRNMVLRHPKTVEQGMEVVDRVFPEIVKEFPNIPKDVLIETIIKNPNIKQDDSDNDGYRENLSALYNNVSRIINSIPCGDTFLNGTKLPKEESNTKGLFALFGLEKLIYNLIIRRGSAFKESDLVKAVKEVEEFLNKEKDIKSFSAKRRILSKMVRTGVGMGKGDMTKFFERIKKVEKTRKKMEDKLFDRALEEAEKLNPTNPAWASYYIFLGFSALDKESDPGGFGKDWLKNGKLIVDTLVDDLSMSQSEEVIETFFEDTFEILLKYLSNINFTKSGIYNDPTSFSEFKYSLVAAPENPKECYDNLRKTNPALAEWDIDKIPIYPNRIPWNEEE